MISVIIPFKDKEVWRIDKLIESFDSEQIDEFIIVDYGSKKKLKYSHPKVKVLHNESIIWNKAHALNIGIKAAKSEYIMTVDVDIVLVDKLDIKLENAFYYSSNVERIHKEDLDDYSKSFPWTDQVTYAWAMCGLANGGLQIYPKKFIEEWNGIDENLIYSGGMDNIVNLMAKKSGMKVIQLPNKILHIEHDKRKHEQFKDKDFAMYCHMMRGSYLNDWIKSPRKNKFWGETKSNCDNLEQMKKDFKEYDMQSLSNQHKVLIAVINNKNYLPQAFVVSLIGLYNYTLQYLPKTELRFMKANSVNEMRNLAVKQSKDFDYLIQLDDDHIYDVDTVIKLMLHKKDIVTVPTKQRVAPFNPTQHKKFLNPIKQEGNYLFTNPGDGLVECEVSGPVAMLIKSDVFNEMHYPYYHLEYMDGSAMSGDYVFCKKLKKHGYKILVDTSINCPHMVNSIINSDGEDAGLQFSDGSF